MLETHYEKNLVINNREIRYTGPFVAEELFRTINSILEEKGYVKREKKTEERITEEGVNTFIELRPYKEKTKYVILMLKIKLRLNNIRNVVKKEKGLSRGFQDGEVVFDLDAWVMTDWEHRWSINPIVFFMKSFINKFVYPLPMESGFTGELMGDAGYLCTKVRHLLRSYQEPLVALPVEEEVRKAVKEEVKRAVEEEVKSAVEEKTKRNKDEAESSTDNEDKE